MDIKEIAHVFVEMGPKVSDAVHSDQVAKLGAAINATALKAEDAHFAINDLAAMMADVKKAIGDWESGVDLKLDGVRTDTVTQLKSIQGAMDNVNGAWTKAVEQLRQETISKSGTAFDFLKSSVARIDADLAQLHQFHQWAVDGLDKVEKQIVEAASKVPVPTIGTTNIVKTNQWPSIAAVILALIAISLHFIPT